MAVLVENKKARFDFEILEKYEAGISLSGAEVKSLREKRGNLEGARVLVRGGEAYVVNMDIPPYQPKNQEGYDGSKARRLLLGRNEIAEISAKGDEKGLTIVPISVYDKGRFIKVEIAVARRKKNADKRESIKKRETEREIRRTLKR